MKPSFINWRLTLLSLCSLFIFSLAANADPGAEEVNTKVLLQFASKYATAENVTWKVTKQFSKASFTVNNKQTEVFYNRRNKLMGTSVYVGLKELPAGCVASMKQEYERYTPTSAIQYTNAGGDVSYFVQLENDNNKMVVQVSDDGQLSCIQSERK